MRLAGQLGRWVGDPLYPKNKVHVKQCVCVCADECEAREFKPLVPIELFVWGHVGGWTGACGTILHL